MSKHTPGPWRACKNGDCSCGHVWSIPADIPVATATIGEWGDPGMPYGSVAKDTGKANARLIAAAPDLLRFARYVLRHQSRARMMERAREVISLVEDGRQ